MLILMITNNAPDESLWATRRAPAASPPAELHGYPALDAADETDETLVSEPPERAEKKPKGQVSEQASRWPRSRSSLPSWRNMLHSIATGR